MRKPFFYYETPNELIIEILGTIDFKVWAVWYGYIQNLIEQCEKETISIDLTKCEECISISMVSLFLSLSKKRATGNRIKILLNNECDETCSRKMYESFVNLGIFDLCKKNGIELIIDNKAVLDMEKYCSMCQVSDDILIPLMTINTKTINDIYAYVKDLVEIRIRNFECEDTTRIKIENILFETMDNIKKHAYREEKEGFAGILVCKKEGFLGKEGRIDQKRKLLFSLRNQYGKDYDGIDLDYLYQKQTYYEIIVIDEGVGITDTLEVRNMDGKYTKYPFLQSFKRTILEGERKKYLKQEEKSYYSGLNLVFNLLAENSDYVYGKEKEVFVFTQCGHSKPSISHRLYQNEECVFKGLAWIFHIGGEVSNINDYYSYQPKISKNESLLKITQEADSVVRNEFDNICIWDERRIANLNKNIFYDANRLSENFEEYIWIVEGHYGKNTVIRELEKKMSLINKGNSTIIIANIYDFDMMIFYLAIQNTYFFNETCYKIIAVSRTLRVAVFERKKNNIFYYNRSMTFKLYMNNEGRKLEDSIMLIYRFLRKYDSGILWSKILQSEKRRYWIKRGCINWEQLKLKYYVNLEMILENYELYELIQCNLERIKGFVNRFGEFKNTDIIMKKVCIDANREKSSLIQDYSKVYVESVYVSGKTDQIIEPRSCDIKICLFHNNILINKTNESKKVSHIFIWPEEDILEKWIEIESQEFERKGNTHTIQVVASKNVLSNIIERKKDRIYKNNYYDFLHDMSYTYAGFVKLGHFSYHSNHDVFSFNIIAMMKMGFYEKNGPFLFVLRKFINCFGKKAYTCLKDEWKNAVGEFENLTEKSSIMVYRSHYYTEYIIKLLYECFEPGEETIWNTTISLDSIEEKTYMNPLTISDIQYDYIVNMIERYSIVNECRVLFFDTMISSGQTSRDIQNIFESISNNINKKLYLEYFYLFDCENLQYTRASKNDFFAYYRIDIPRMGRKKSCIFCKIIENISKYYNIFLSTLAKQRILKWAEIWRPISPLLVQGSYGFSNSKVENLKKIWKEIGINAEIEYCDFYTFATQLVEIGYTNHDKEFLSNICDKEDLLSVEQKMQLLEMQILLFGVEDNYKLYYNVLRKLVKYMNQLEVTSNATALAAMLIINGDKDVVFNIFAEINDKFEGLNNEDVLITFAILCYSDRRLQRTRLYEQVNCLLDFKKYDLNLLKELHSQIYNVHGVWHGTYLEKLTKPYGNAEKLINGCNAAYNSLTYIANIVSRINLLAIHSDRVCNLGAETLTKNLQSYISNQSKELDEIRKSIQDDWHALPKEYVERLENTVSKLKEFHATLFIPYGKESKEYGRPLTRRVENVLKDIGEKCVADSPQERILEIMREMRNDGLFPFWDQEKDEVYSIGLEQYHPDFEPEVREIWYVWDKRMEEEFKYLISDIRHCCGKREHRSFGEVNMIISFKYNEKNASIILKTISSIDHNEIIRKLEEKTRYQREIIQRNGAQIRYSSIKSGDKYLLTTILEIKAVC